MTTEVTTYNETRLNEGSEEGRIRILLVEPRSIYASGLTAHLSSQLFVVQVVSSEVDARAVLLTGDPDVVMACVGGDQRGVQMLDRLRTGSASPVIAVTDDEIASVLWNGPTLTNSDVRSLSSRVRDALRHPPANGDAGNEPHRGADARRAVGDLEVDLTTRRVLLQGEPTSLTRTEFQILALLLMRPGEVITRRHLQDQLWGPTWVGNRHTIGVHIGRLRRKLGDDPGAPRYVLTVRGIGYRLGS